MKLLANENFSFPSYNYLINNSIDIIHISTVDPGIPDEQVLRRAISDERSIVTFDSDYGEIVFKYKIRPPKGIIYIRMKNYRPEEPGEIILSVLNKHQLSFDNKITVLDKVSIRQKSYL